MVEQVTRACGIMGISPFFFVAEALRRALRVTDVTEIKQASVAHEVRRHRRRLSVRTAYRHRALL